MKHLVEFTLKNGSTVLMEAEDSNAEERIFPASLRSSSTGITKVSKETFEESIEILKPVADAIFNKLNNMCNKPKKLRSLSVFR